MGIAQSQFAPWTRKHDKPGNPLVPQAASIQYPQSLEDLIAICSSRPAGQRLHAAGSHWALSAAAVSDSSFIETNDPNNVFPAMDRTLYNVVPGCLSDKFLSDLNRSTTASGFQATPFYFVHFESGKRIYQLYAELDVGDDKKPASLCALMKSRFGNDSFGGSWGFLTLGGAGGQTVVGALSTGTHGGDFDRAPLADAVVALHLVADSGQHYWIEKGLRDSPAFTDEEKLRAIYGDIKYGGGDNFSVIYDEDVLRAAMVQVGRFGIVYSAVIQVTRQYGLRQDVALDEWGNLKGKIADPHSDLFTQVYTSPDYQRTSQRFLQIVVNPIPSTNGTTHLCGITRRWTVPVASLEGSPLPKVNWEAPGNPKGRPEIVGNILDLHDPLLDPLRFSNAGKTVGYSPDGSGITTFDPLDSACADGDFIDGIVDAIYTEIETFLSDNAVAEGGALAGAVALGAGPGLAALAPELLAILALLALFLEALRRFGPKTLGEAMNDLSSALLGSSNPQIRAAGIIVWRAIAAKVFESQQKPQTFSAMSYAIMDTHNYTDRSCNVNARSMEVFFDAADPALIAFVDRLLKFEADQEFDSGRTVVGYISLRFTGRSVATIAQQPWDRTCAIECSALADVDGSTEFVDYAVKLALDPNIKGILHWGQQNTSTQAEVEFRFGDSAAAPGGPLAQWRSVLSRLTENGLLDGFSSEFTRRTGLEIVQPKIGDFRLSSSGPPTAHDCTVSWSCAFNPPGTAIRLEIHQPSGAVASVTGLALVDTHKVVSTGGGSYAISLVASLVTNGVTRQAKQTLTVTLG